MSPLSLLEKSLHYIQYVLLKYVCKYAHAYLLALSVMSSSTTA